MLKIILFYFYNLIVRGIIKVKCGAFMIYSLTELKNLILPIIKKYKAENAILFGSHARKQATAHSDIDLIVIGGMLLILLISLLLRKNYMNHQEKMLMSMK